MSEDMSYIDHLDEDEVRGALIEAEKEKKELAEDLEGAKEDYEHSQDNLKYVEKDKVFYREKVERLEAELKENQQISDRISTLIIERDAEKEKLRVLKEESMTEAEFKDILDELRKELTGPEAQKELQERLKPFFIKFRDIILGELKEKVEELSTTYGGCKRFAQPFQEEVLKLIEEAGK
jgi:chromosome segregation ATPase